MCPNFDYCEKCEAQREHNHPFLKIRRPEQAPAAMYVSISEDFPSFIRDAPPAGASLLHQGNASRCGAKKIEEQHIFELLQHKNSLQKLQSETAAAVAAATAATAAVTAAVAVKPAPAPVAPVATEEKKEEHIEDLSLAKSIIVSPQPRQQVPQYPPAVIEMGKKVSEILSGKPEDYYETINNLPGASIDQICQTILNEQSYYSKAKPVRN